MSKSRLPNSRFRAFGAIAAAALLSACADTLVFDDNLPKPHDYPIHGIDVSKFQGDIDWSAVSAAGVRFAYIKATEGGDHADERFEANWSGAKAVGLPHGAYHFVYWCRPWNEEMAWFERNVPVEPDALPPVLDVEATPTSHTCRRRLERESAQAEMRQMLAEMQRHYGKRPVIYTTVDFYEAILSDGGLSDYPIWVRSTKHNPEVKYGSRQWSFWQYQSDARVPGIAVNVDRNAFHGDAAQWRQFAQLDPAPQSAQPVQMAAVVQAPDAYDAQTITPPLSIEGLIEAGK